MPSVWCPAVLDLVWVVSDVVRLGRWGGLVKLWTRLALVFHICRFPGAVMRLGGWKWNGLESCIHAGCVSHTHRAQAFTPLMTWQPNYCCEAVDARVLVDSVLRHVPLTYAPKQYKHAIKEGEG